MEPRLLEIAELFFRPLSIFFLHFRCARTRSHCDQTALVSPFIYIKYYAFKFVTKSLTHKYKFTHKSRQDKNIICIFKSEWILEIKVNYNKKLKFHVFISDSFINPLIF